MKVVILAGDSGTNLLPLSEVTQKTIIAGSQRATRFTPGQAFKA